MMGQRWKVMCKIYVNHYGWVAAFSKERGCFFVKNKDGAKPYPLMPDYETEKVLRFIEGKMQCHRDVVQCMVPDYGG
jgi:hypothetical protein